MILPIEPDFNKAGCVILRERERGKMRGLCCAVYCACTQRVRRLLESRMALGQNIKVDEGVCHFLSLLITSLPNLRYQRPILHLSSTGIPGSTRQQERLFLFGSLQFITTSFSFWRGSENFLVLVELHHMSRCLRLVTLHGFLWVRAGSWLWGRAYQLIDR